MPRHTGEGEHKLAFYCENLRKINRMQSDEGASTLVTECIYHSQGLSCIELVSPSQGPSNRTGSLQSRAFCVQCSAVASSNGSHMQCCAFLRF